MVEWFYNSATYLFGPLIKSIARRKHVDMNAPASRLPERSGHTTLARPAGPLIWVHGASMGEIRSILPVIDDLLKSTAELTVLVTTTTQTGAALAQSQGPRVVHQFAPLDLPQPVNRFLTNWRPNLAIFVENDLMPRASRALVRHQIPQVTINLRPSRTRTRFPKLAAKVLTRSAFLTAKDNDVQQTTVKIGVPEHLFLPPADLKAASQPLPYQVETYDFLQRQLAGRPRWLACSIHPEDDALVLDAHQLILKEHPNALLIMIPRHPDRADLLDQIIAAEGFTHARRSQGQDPTPDDQVYLADTMGETGLFFRMSPVTLLGGSFGSRGGHNPWEPAILESIVLHGPDIKNAVEAYESLSELGAAHLVRSGSEIAKRVFGSDIASPRELSKLTAAARNQRQRIVARVLDLI